MLRLREGGVVRCGEWTEGALSALSPALSALSPSSAASVKHANPPFPGASGDPTSPSASGEPCGRTTAPMETLGTTSAMTKRVRAPTTGARTGGGVGLYFAIAATYNV